MIEKLLRLFPLWAIALSAFAYYQPAHFTELKAGIIPLLTIIMFSMGLTLNIDDFKRALAMPKLIVTGLILQYTVMPVSALIVANLLQLDSALIIGMILVGSCPGGTASNVITYLAKGNVALSISLTSISTVIAIILTPGITWILADTIIDVPTGKMLISILNIVILPVTLGLLLRHFFERRIQQIESLLPLVAAAAIILIIAIITALNIEQLNKMAATVVLAVVLHNTLGLVTGYLTARKLGYTGRECRTLAIEVGMQNSGLAVALALKHFSAAAALPGAVFSIWHNISGSLLAGYWSRSRNNL